MFDVNCKDCRYRYWLAKYGSHVWGIDCDQIGTDFCKKMNDPEFRKYMEEQTNGKEKNR